jgi:hypothetical protein
VTHHICWSNLSQERQQVCSQGHGTVRKVVSFERWELIEVSAFSALTVHIRVYDADMTMKKRELKQSFLSIAGDVCFGGQILALP